MNLISELARPTQCVFFEFAVDGVPAGRVVIGLYGDEAPMSVKRFEALVKGSQGVGCVCLVV